MHGSGPFGYNIGDVTIKVNNYLGVDRVIARPVDIHFFISLWGNNLYMGAIYQADDTGNMVLQKETLLVVSYPVD